VCFIFRKTTSILEHAILTTLYFAGADDDSGAQRADGGSNVLSGDDDATVSKSVGTESSPHVRVIHYLAPCLLGELFIIQSRCLNG
jgi:hypothetical protein